MPVFEWSSIMPVSADDLYEWQARPSTFERLIPPWQRLRVVERPQALVNGARLELLYRGGPVKGRWVAEYTGVVRGRQFVDRQVQGPFGVWEHTHRFVPRGEGQSELIDHVEYELPLGRLSGGLGSARITAGLQRIFRLRHARTRGDLERHGAWKTRAPLKVAIGGATGMIGSHLATYLAGAGHEVVRLVRRPAVEPDEVSWDPAAGRIDPSQLAGVGAVVNLSGVSTAGLWTAARRRAILASRMQATTTLVNAMTQMETPPSVFVSASAVGAYGSRGDEEITERSSLGGGFLADVCREWEAAASKGAAAGMRVVTPRFGIVMSAAGGALAKMLPAFKAGLGVRIGDGRQWWSWVELDDLLSALEWVLHDAELSGAVNISTPRPVSNVDFTRTLGYVLHRPAGLVAPRSVVALGLGGLGEEMFLASQRAVPARLEARGFRFSYPDLEAALRFELGRR
jgi:uncharacterized protein